MRRLVRGELSESTKHDAPKSSRKRTSWQHFTFSLSGFLLKRIQRLGPRPPRKVLVLRNRSTSWIDSSGRPHARCAFFLTSVSGWRIVECPVVRVFGDWASPKAFRRDFSFALRLCKATSF